MESTNLKTSLQTQAARQLSGHKRLLVQWATGCGKSGVVLDFIKNNPGFSTLIVVPETNNIQNWEQEFEKFGVDTFGVTIICYASLKNYVNTSWHLLVLDETPHANTDLRVDFLSTISAEYVVALGAVISYEEKATLQSLYGKFFSNKITLDEAIEKKLLPSPDVRILHMTLDNTVKDHIYRGVKCSAKGKYDFLNAEVNRARLQYDMRSTQWNLNKMKQAGVARKRFLGEMQTEALKSICAEIQKSKKRYLCFCASIAQAELLGGKQAYTSKTSNQQMVLDKFNNHDINALYVVGKLIEGQNLKDIDCGVIGNIGNTDRITVQEMGRIMRSDNPIIYVPIFDDTKQEKFLESLTNNVSSEYIKHFRLDNHMNVIS